MNRKIRNFRDLDVWQLGKKLVIDIYKITQSLPNKEIYGLVSQMRRAVISIPSNIAEIAEGFNRSHNREYRQFLYIALGSCAELETQIEIAFELKYVKETSKNELLEAIDHETRMLRNLIKKL